MPRDLGRTAPPPPGRTGSPALRRAGRTAGRTGVVALATAAGLAGLLLVGAPALASRGDVRGTVSTGGAVLNIRPAPNTDASPTGWLADEEKFTIICQRTGQQIEGEERTTKLWDRLKGGEYVSDAYVRRTGPRPPRCEGHAIRRPSTSDEWALPISAPAGSGYRTKQRPDHDGVDFSAARKTPIHAIAAGTVIVSICDPGTGRCNVDGSMRASGCGWYVDIRHADEVVTRYCHMVRRPEVRTGDSVTTGQVIGYVGSSGNSSGPHLHFEVHRGSSANHGNAVDPIRFLRSVGLSPR